MPTIDFHNHYYPPAYLAAVRAGQSDIEIQIDDDGNPRLYYPGDYNIVVAGHWDIDHREQVLIEHGVDTQVLTLTTPGTHIETRENAIRLAELVNNAFADVVRSKKGRFTALATLPLNAPDAAATELRRACRDLDLAGAMLFSNVNGAGLDEQQFWPIYEVANELGAVLYIHPTSPVGVEAMTNYWLMPLTGFLSDTTLAAAKIVFSGVIERFPRIQWVLCHLGGAIPYLGERLDRGFHAFRECRENISKPPTEYLRKFYYDTVNFDGEALQLAIRFAGPERIMAGSDYPHLIGSIPSMLSSIRSLDIPDDQRSAIFGGNAARLLRLS